MRIYIIIGCIVAALGMLTASYAKGRSDGKAYQEKIADDRVAALNLLLKEKDDILVEKEKQRLLESEKFKARLIELRTQANEDPFADRVALSVDSVRRINSVR